MKTTLDPVIDLFKLIYIIFPQQKLYSECFMQAFKSFIGPTLKYGAALSHQRPLPGAPVGCSDALRPLLLLDQVLLVLAEHQTVLHLVAARDVVQVLQLVQDVVRQVHVRDPLFGDAGQLRLLEIEDLVQ